MGRAVGGGRHLPVRPVEEPGRDLLGRHAAADRQRVAAHGVGVRVRADRLDRAVPAHAGRRGLLSDGVGRQRARDRAPGPELLRRAVRPVAAVRPGLHAAREAGEERDPGVAAELRGAVRTPDPDRRAGVRGAVAAARAVGRLVVDLHDDRRGRPARVAARVPPEPRPRRGVPGRGADAVGRRRPHRGRAGRARRP